MRIVIATGLYPPESGGPATYTKLLEDRLPERHFSVSVLPFRDVRRLPKVLRHIAYFWKCVRVARTADAVFAQDTVSVGLPSALASMLARKKFLVRVPGDYAWEQGKQRFRIAEGIDAFQKRTYGLRIELLRRVQRFVVRRAHLVIAPSEYLRDIVAGWGADPARIVCIHNGIEIPVPVEPPARRPEGFLVVSVGRRVPWKGFEALERTVAREKGWTLHIAENLPRPQALGWVKIADVFVLNSSYEGLSHVLLEAMSLGVPIVATKVGGNPELVRDGVEGILIPPHDDSALYAALKKLEREKEYARALGTAAARRARDFTIEKTLDALCGVLRSL